MLILIVSREWMYNFNVKHFHSYQITGISRVFILHVWYLHFTRIDGSQSFEEK